MQQSEYKIDAKIKIKPLRQNQAYILSNDKNFSEFIQETKRSFRTKTSHGMASPSPGSFRINIAEVEPKKENI